MSKQTLAELLASNPWGRPQQEPTPLARILAKAVDEPIGAFERWGHRGANMRQQGLDLINASLDPNVGQLHGLGMAALGAGMIPASPFLSLLPSSQELRDRGRAAGGGDLNQAIGGAIGDLVNIPDPATSATALATLGKAALTAKGLAAAAPILGKSAAVAPLGKGLAELLAEASPAEQLALKARLEAEAGQTGGQAVSASRDQALENLVNQPQRREVTTASYKETYPDGTTQWAPGTFRANPTTAERFQPEMTIADVKRYIEQYGEPPMPRTKGELVTGKRKDLYPDGTVEPVPGLLRTKRPPASAAVAPLGKGLAELMAEASPAEQLALKARLEAEAGQVGGAASNVSRERALQDLTGGTSAPSDLPDTWYHGSPADIYGKDGSGRFRLTAGETGVPAIWATSDPFSAEGYSRGEIALNYDDAAGKFPLSRSWYKDYDGGGGVYGLKSAAKNPYIADAEGKAWTNVQQGKIMREAKAKGHDAVIFRNIADNYQSGGPKSDVIAFLTEDAIKPDKK